MLSTLVVVYEEKTSNCSVLSEIGDISEGDLQRATRRVTWHSRYKLERHSESANLLSFFSAVFAMWQHYICPI